MIGQNEIVIIQGDSYEAELDIKGLIDVSVVEKCIFSSNYLGVCKMLELSDDESKYILKFTPLETNNMKNGISDFDITLFFKDTNVATVIYKGDIKIFDKKNKVTCNG